MVWDQLYISPTLAIANGKQLGRVGRPFAADRALFSANRQSPVHSLPGVHVHSPSSQRGTPVHLAQSLRMQACRGLIRQIKRQHPSQPASMPLAAGAAAMASGILSLASVAQDADTLAAGLPILEVLGQAIEALDKGTSLVLRAPPGAGKTTVLPLAILERCSGTWLRPEQRILVRPFHHPAMHCPILLISSAGMPLLILCPEKHSAF